MRLVRRLPLAPLLLAASALAACGGAGSTTAMVESPVSTAAPTTTVAPTTTTSTTTTTTTTTLPTPIAPPQDTKAAEPVIELGTISIPAIDVEMTMYEGIRLTTLDLGPGHWPGTAMPGQAGNVVVAGHRTSGHKVFRNVDQLQSGDEIVFEDSSGRHVYRVTRTEIVPPTALWIVDQTPTPTATLFACHPPGSTAERIVVFADLVQ